MAVRPQPTRHTLTGSTKLSSQLLWAGGAVLAVVLLVGGMAILASGGARMPASGAEPTEKAVAQVDTSVPIATDNPVLTVTETRLPSPTTTKTSTATRTPTITSTSEPVLGIGSTMVNPIDGAVMVYVPEGEFLMGSKDDNARNDEKPQRRTFVDAFWIYQLPVTNEQYRACVNVNRCGSLGLTSYYTLSNYADHPVVFVSWFNANAYCQWVGGRLPTEAEWEKAARGTDGRRYTWGDQSPTCNLGNFADCVGGTSPVGSYPAGASPYGALDMASNVWEWVSDWYDPDYYSRSPYENPTGPESGIYRVRRGGHLWMADIPWDPWITVRNYSSPDSSYDFTGFRCLLLP